MFIKKFDNFVNEDIKQYLKPKSEEEILKSVWVKLKGLSPRLQLTYISKNNLEKTIPLDYITTLVNDVIDDIKDKTLTDKIIVVFDDDIEKFFTEEYKEVLIKEVLRTNTNKLKHKNIICVNNIEWNFSLFVNSDNLKTNLVAFHSSKHVWKTIKKLI